MSPKCRWRHRRFDGASGPCREGRVLRGTATCPTRHLRPSVLGFDDGVLGMIMVIHTFGDYARFYTHLHAIVADWLFRPNGTFYCLPKRDLKELEEIFHPKRLAMVEAGGRINDVLIEKLMAWHHCGFSVHAGNHLARDDREGQQSLNTCTWDNLSLYKSIRNPLFRKRASNCACSTEGIIIIGSPPT
jgi:hypothetical protein